MNKKRLTLYFIIVMSVIFVSALLIINSVRFPAVSRISINGENLTALNKASVKGVSTFGNNYQYYKFTENQKVRFSNQMSKNGGYALKVSLAADAGDFFLGYLYESDFSESGKLKHSLDARPLVSGTFNESNKKVSVMMTLTKGQDSPSGFFVYGQKKMYLTDAGFYGPALGFDYSKNTPCFAYGSNGGSVIWNNTFWDFSDAEKIFTGKNNSDFTFPVAIVDLMDGKTGTWEKPFGINLMWGSETFFLRRSPLTNVFNIQAASLKNPFAQVKCDSELKRLLMINNPDENIRTDAGEPLSALSTDLGFILDWPEENWRFKDYELYKWDSFPGVLFFDFANYKIQNEFFTRLAFFVEKAGYKGTLVGDDFVENKHGYNAHDYKASDLADFFTKVDAENFQLNDREKLLCKILEYNKIISRGKDGTYKAGTGCVISISRESPDYLRNTFLAHESWHGVFFTDADFRNVVSSLYYMCDTDSLEFLKRFWETQPGLGYDRNDEYLMQNEFMAYIMQQSFLNIKNYFLQVSGRGSVNRFEKELAEYIRNTEAQAFVDAGAVLNDYAFNKWGLACGRVNLVSRK